MLPQFTVLIVRNTISWEKRKKKKKSHGMLAVLQHGKRIERVKKNWVRQKNLGASKNFGWTRQNILGASKHFGRVKKVGRVKKFWARQNIWGRQNILGASKHFGRVKIFWARQNILGASKNLGASKYFGRVIKVWRVSFGFGRVGRVEKIGRVGA